MVHILTEANLENIITTHFNSDNFKSFTDILRSDDSLTSDI